MGSLTIESGRLKGKVLSQPSKSMAHRALLCALLAKGASIIDNIVLSKDIEATLNACKALGADIIVSASDRYKGRKQVKILSTGMINPVDNIIDCHESGSTARFIMPVTRLCSSPVIVTGSGRLVTRPFDIYKELFMDKGIEYSDNDGKMPIRISGKLKPGEYSLKGDVSSQFISGLLFALPLLEGDSVIRVIGQLESLPYIKMTMAAMKKFGVDIDFDDDYKTYRIKGSQTYKACSMTVEGDWSQAAFFCILGAISGDIEIEGLDLCSLQGDMAIIDIIKRMGADVSLKGDDIVINNSALKAVEVDVSQCPDLVPALSVAMSLCEGKSEIKNAERLRIKESDRLKAVCNELNKLGAKIEEKPDGLKFEGVPRLYGSNVEGWNDHRIVMALAIASSICEGNIKIEGYEAVTKSYPEFWEDFRSLGGTIQ